MCFHCYKRRVLEARVAVVESYRSQVLGGVMAALPCVSEAALTSCTHEPICGHCAREAVHSSLHRVFSSRHTDGYLTQRSPMTTQSAEALFRATPRRAVLQCPELARMAKTDSPGATRVVRALPVGPDLCVSIVYFGCFLVRAHRVAVVA